MRLFDVKGQRLATTTLVRAIKSNHISHAYLFHGQYGVGKETVAKAFSNHLFCEDASACGKCRGCLRFSHGNHSDYHCMKTDTTIKIGRIRELHEACYLKHEGYAVWLIKNIEKMTLPAANSFLKVLEEPPEDTVFLLLTENIGQVLPTIVSRCQQLQFPRLSQELVESLLREHLQVEEDESLSKKIQLVAKLANGSIGRALELWEGPVLDRRSWVIQQLMRIPNMSTSEVLGLSLGWSEERADLESDLTLMLQWYRDLWCIKSRTQVQPYNLDYQNDLAVICEKYSVESLRRVTEQIQNVFPYVQRNVRPRFLLGHLLLQMRKGALT